MCPAVSALIVDEEEELEDDKVHGDPVRTSFLDELHWVYTITDETQSEDTHCAYKAAGVVREGVFLNFSEQEARQSWQAMRQQQGACPAKASSTGQVDCPRSCSVLRGCTTVSNTFTADWSLSAAGNAAEAMWSPERIITEAFLNNSRCCPDVPASAVFLQSVSEPGDKGWTHRKGDLERLSSREP